MQRNETFNIANPQVEIDNTAGRVELINREDGTVEVTVESLTSHAVEIVEATTIVANGNIVRVSVPNRSGFRRRDVLVRVVLPATATANISTVSADVEGGEISRLAVKAVSGSIRFLGIQDSAELKSVSGLVHISRSSKEITVSSTSGDVWLDQVSGRCSIRSVSGDCTVHAIGVGDINVRTVSGDVKILVDQGIEIDVEAQTLSGRLSSDIALDGSTSGAGGPSLSIHSRTVSGDLRIGRSSLVG